MTPRAPFDKVLIRIPHALVWLCASGLGMQIEGARYRAYTGLLARCLARCLARGWAMIEKR